MSERELSLQERFAPRLMCFGCGPENKQGLRIQSFPRGDLVVCEWTPLPWCEAWEGTLSGGIVGTLLDCHSNWTAAWFIRDRRGMEGVPTTVTAEYSVRLQRPASTAGPILLQARPLEVEDERAVIEATLTAGGRQCASFRGTFVAVREGHPAWGRW